MTKREFAQDFIKQNPGVPTSLLSREMRREYPDIFHSDEAARDAIRYVKGAHGKKGRMDRGLEPRIPDSSEHVWGPYDLEARDGDRIALLSDIHIPYHSKSALELAIKEAKRRKANIILLNGDTMDAHELSRFEKDPRERSFREEIPLVKQFLAYLRHTFPKARIIWKDGNHDERLYLYLRRHAPALLGLDSFEAQSVLGLDENGLGYVTGKRPITCGKLNILHGHEYPTSALGVVNPARGLFLRAGACAIEGHYHQTSEHAQPNLEGKSIACWSTGCLSELHPPYMPLNKWNHGFAMIEMGKAGNFKVSNHKIINGEIY